MPGTRERQQITPAHRGFTAAAALIGGGIYETVYDAIFSLRSNWVLIR
ncbi:hypothetical protein BH23GEM6_BH23GEM6_24400 [soil metagenome]